MPPRREKSLRTGRAVRVLVLACAALACSSGEARDVVLITVDTLRPDHLGIYGYERATSPSIDRFFAHAAIFERVYATEASTPPATVSILSGLLPQDHRVRLFYQLLPPDTAVLPDLLPDTFQTAAFVSNVVLTDEALGMAKRFDHYDDFVDERESLRRVYERGAERTTDAALLWLAEQYDPKRPLFLWVHYIDPHGPYRPPQDKPVSFDHEGFVALEPDRVHAFQREPGVDDALAYVDRYDEEIANVDLHVGRLLEALGRAIDLDQALVVFTADHGESMIEHERWFTHGYNVYEGIVRVPLLLRGPGVEPGRRAELVSSIDVAPTILAFAGAEPPARVHGRDLRRAAPSAARAVFAEAGGGFAGGGRIAYLWRAAVRGNEKWVARVPENADEGVRGWRADLAADPGELAKQPWPRDWQNEEGSLGSLLLERIRADPDRAGVPQEYATGERLRQPKVSPRADADALERLRALGYVE